MIDNSPKKSLEWWVYKTHLPKGRLKDMPTKKLCKGYINTFTGEIITAKNRRFALRYFRADGKRVGYSVRARDIKRFPKRDGKQG